jgi:hypothetical protein
MSMKLTNENHPLLIWLRGKLADAEATLKAREQMEATWKGGDAKSWKAVGCKLNQSQRLKESAMQGRIASKYRIEVQMFKATLEELLSKPQQFWRVNRG